MQVPIGMVLSTRSSACRAIAALVGEIDEFGVGVSSSPPRIVDAYPVVGVAAGTIHVGLASPTSQPTAPAVARTWKNPRCSDLGFRCGAEGN